MDGIDVSVDGTGLAAARTSAADGHVPLAVVDVSPRTGDREVFFRALDEVLAVARIPDVDPLSGTRVRCMIGLLNPLTGQVACEGLPHTRVFGRAGTSTGVNLPAGGALAALVRDDERSLDLVVALGERCGDSRLSPDLACPEEAAELAQLLLAQALADSPTREGLALCSTSGVVVLPSLAAALDAAAFEELRALHAPVPAGL